MLQVSQLWLVNGVRRHASEPTKCGTYLPTRARVSVELERGICDAEGRFD